MSVENILAIYKMATPEEKRDGVVWYADALRDCTRIAVDLDLPVHIVTGVVAALSPNNKWDETSSMRVIYAMPSSMVTALTV